MEQGTDKLALERPDEHQAGAANELYCWMPDTDHRECGPDCVAYDPTFVDDQVKDPCKALNSVRSMAMSLAKIAGSFQQRSKAEQAAALKQHMDNLPPPPKATP